MFHPSHRTFIALLSALACSAFAHPTFGQDDAPSFTKGDIGIPGADPSVIHTRDGYVAVESRRGHALLVRVAQSLEALPAARAVRVWFDKERLGEVWAPEIVFRDGSYSIFFAAGVGSDHRMYEISSAKPDADYGPALEVPLPDDKWAIDGMPFNYNGTDYFVWSGWQGDTDVQQDLFLVRLGDDGKPQGPRALISSPDQAWENVAGETPGINEGPQPVVDPNGQLHIVYSANGSWGANYCLADLRLKSGADPMVADAWVKSNGCLFGANEATLSEGAALTAGARGVGHHSFILPDGDPERAQETGTPAPFFYHGVPDAIEQPSNFWAARQWFIGTYEWVSDVTYGTGDQADKGWSLRFSE